MNLQESSKRVVVGRLIDAQAIMLLPNFNLNGLELHHGQVRLCLLLVHQELWLKMQDSLEEIAEEKAS